MKPATAVVLIGLAACSHGDAFVVPTFGTDQPFQPGAPARLTFSAHSDSEATWLPDGSAILYSAYRPDFPDTTTCLELLPPGGGQAYRSLCPLAPALPDSTRAYQAAAVSGAGQLLYLRSARMSPNLGWSVRQLVLTTLAAPATVRVVLASPFLGYNGLSQIRWLDERHFVYRADNYYLIFPCQTCHPIEADTGLFLVAGDLSADPPGLTELPGTAGATSVAAADSGAVLFTLSGDSIVYREVVATGAISAEWNFGFGTVAGAVQLAGTRLAALVNGRVVTVDLASRTTTVVDTLVWTDLALSPDGTRLVAQRGGDLWLFGLP